MFPRPIQERLNYLVFSMWVCNVFPKSTMKHYPFKTVANSLKVVSVCSCPGWWAASWQSAGQLDGLQRPVGCLMTPGLTPIQQNVEKKLSHMYLVIVCMPLQMMMKRVISIEEFQVHTSQICLVCIHITTLVLP